MIPTIESAVLPFAVGLLAGMLYFGGLWLTVRRLPNARRPVLLLAGSASVRLGLLMSAAYLVTDGRWERLAACILGILVARTALLLLRWRLPRPAGS